MKSKDRDFVIPFVGLKLGVHDFEYSITDAFFEDIEYSLIRKGEVNVKLTLEKKETMMLADFSVSGRVNTNCDRCNDPLDAVVEGDYRLIYKFGEDPSDDESLVTIFPEEYEIDVTAPILEFITVSLPARVLHEEGACNEEMIGILDEYVINIDKSDEDLGEDESDGNDPDDIDPRWEALKNIK